MFFHTPIGIIFKNKRRFQNVPFGDLHVRGAGVECGQQLEVGALREPGQVLLQAGGPGEDHEEQAGAGGPEAPRLQPGPPR